MPDEFNVKTIRFYFQLRFSLNYYHFDIYAEYAINYLQKCIYKLFTKKLLAKMTIYTIIIIY